jgi:hypothetical protein
MKPSFRSAGPEIFFYQRGARAPHGKSHYRDRRNFIFDIAVFLIDEYEVFKYIKHVAAYT